MNDLMKLIKTVASAPDREKVILELVSKGAEVVPSVVEAMRTLQAPPLLIADVLLQLRDKESCTAMLQFLDEEDGMIRLPIIKALGYGPPKVVSAPLKRLVTNTEERVTPRQFAADSLGELGEPETVGVLAPLVDEALTQKQVDLALACVCSMGKLGDSTRIDVVFKETKNKTKPLIRSHAVQCLRYVSGEGLFEEIDKASRDKNHEVRLECVHAAYSLSDERSISLLAKMTKDKAADVASLSSHLFSRATGFEGEPDAIPAWLRGEKDKFDRETSYRLGKPRSLKSLIEMLADPWDLETTLLEFFDYTGVSLGSDVLVRYQKERLKQTVRDYCERESGKFERGVPYRRGHKVDRGSL